MQKITMSKWKGQAMNDPQNQSRNLPPEIFEEIKKRTNFKCAGIKRKTGQEQVSKEVYLLCWHLSTAELKVDYMKSKIAGIEKRLDVIEKNSYLNNGEQKKSEVQLPIFENDEVPF